MSRKEIKRISNLSGLFGIMGILFGLLFLSPVITGNAIGNIDLKVCSLFGVILFILGISGLHYFWGKH